MNKEELLKEAKRRYPIGTWIKSIYTDDGKERQLLPYKEGDTELTWHTDSYGVRSTGGITTNPKYGGGCSNPLVWENTKGWVPITKFAPKSFKVGDRVKVIANSLKEFNLDFTEGNNTVLEAGNTIYTIIDIGSSIYPEVDKWVRLGGVDRNNGISINLLELVEESKVSDNVLTKGDVVYIIPEKVREIAPMLSTTYSLKENTPYIVDRIGSYNWGNINFPSNLGVILVEHPGDYYGYTPLECFTKVQPTINDESSDIRFIENRVHGEYYYFRFSTGEIICKWNEDIDKTQFIQLEQKYYKQARCCETSSYNEARLATSEERQWLDACISKDEYMEKDVALKSKEFVLPEKWCVFVTKEQRALLPEKYGNRFYYSKGSYIYSYKVNGHWSYCPYEGGSATESVITFEQFQQYVLNQEVKEEKVMEEYKFKVGDRVECIMSPIENSRIKSGLQGNIVHIGDIPPFIGVEWDSYVEGHNCSGRCKEGYGYYVSAENIKLIEPKYYPDLSQHIGRYIEALVDYPSGGNVKKGEVGIILDRRRVDFPSQKGYCCETALSKGNKNYYKLLPENYKPEAPTPSTPVFTKDSYVVISSYAMASIIGTDLYTNYCYQLNNDISKGQLSVYKDTAGNSNSWSLSAFKLRAATETEIKVYKALGKPYKIGNTEAETKQILLDEVARRYPIGTRYRGLNSEGDVKEAHTAEYEPQMLTHGIEVGERYVYIFSTNKWADILYSGVIPNTGVTTSLNTTICPYRSGTSISCKIEGEYIPDAKIYIEGKKVWICQNVKDGDVAPNRLGYNYSWLVVNDWEYANTWETGCKIRTVSEVVPINLVIPNSQSNIISGYNNAVTISSVSCSPLLPDIAESYPEPKLEPLAQPKIKYFKTNKL